MKKTLSFIVAICMITTFSTCVFATDNPVDSAFNFDTLLEDQDNITSLVFGHNLTGVIKDGFWFANLDNSSLKNILSTTTFYGIPTFLLTPFISNDNSTITSYMIPAAQISETNKILRVVGIGNNKAIIPLHSFSTPLKNSFGNTIGYTGNDNVQFVRGKNPYTLMILYINSDNVVYPVILVVGYKTNWNNEFPKNNEELTITLNEILGTQDNYTYYITPDIDSGDILDSSKHHTSHISNPNKRPHYTIASTSTEGGTISSVTPDNQLFLVGDINQKYTVTADEGYTIAYIIVDGQIVPNSINCGDTASFTFECIYGNRSISAIFKKK